MLDRLKALLGSAVAPAEQPEDPTPLAAAMLLFEVAWADHQLTQDEVDSMVAALESLFDIGEAAARALADRAIETHQSETSIYPFTRDINEVLTQDEKNDLITTLWRLALADQIVDKYEEHAIRRIADLLYVPHREFIRAKQRAQRED